MGRRPGPGLRDVSGCWQGEGVGCFSGELELSKTKHGAVPQAQAPWNCDSVSCCGNWCFFRVSVRVGLGVGQRVGELSGFSLGGVESPHQRKGLGRVLKIAIHLGEHEAFRYCQRNPRGPK